VVYPENREGMAPQCLFFYLEFKDRFESLMQKSIVYNFVYNTSKFFPILASFRPSFYSNFNFIFIVESIRQSIDVPYEHILSGGAYKRCNFYLTLP